MSLSSAQVPSGLHICALAWISEYGVYVRSFWRVAVQICLCEVICVCTPERYYGFDCGWSLLSQGVAELKKLDLGNLNPPPKGRLTIQMKGRCWV